MPNRIRLGFIGAGFMGQIAHIANYAQLPDQCELVAIADLRTSLADNVARRYGIAEVYPNHIALLENAEVDAIVAIMGYGHHYSVVPDILGARKHLLTEKPMANDLRNAREWKRLADERHLVYLVGYMKRWDLGTRKVASLIREWRESGEYGALRHVSCEMSGTDWTWGHEAPLSVQPEQTTAPPPPTEPFPARFSEAEARFYNMNINFYVHQVNLLRYLIGEDYRLAYTHPAAKVLVASTDSGVSVAFEMGRHQINRTWDEVYRVSFDGAEITLCMPSPLQRQQNGEVEIRRNLVDGSHEVVTPNIGLPSWSFFEQAKGFLQCVRDGAIPFDSTGEAIRDLEIFEQQVDLMKSVGGDMRT